MRAARRHGLTLAALLAALTARSWQVLPLPLWSCPLRQLTGVPCPTCFLTRSVLATLRGDLVGGLRLHAFGPPLVLAAVAWMAHLLVLGRSPALRQRGLWVGAISGLLCLYWVVRLTHPSLFP